MLVCKECSNADLEILSWVDTNTLSFIKSVSEIVWCNFCKSYVSVKEEQIIISKEDEKYKRQYTERNIKPN